MTRSPYRGLDPFTESAEDAALFFGRDAEIEITAANLLAARLTLLYGPSGVGKSSLLRAGVVHRLRDEAPGGLGQAIVVLDEWQRDPAGELLRRAHVAAFGADEEAPAEPPTDGLVRSLERISRDAGVEFLLVFDQFEEYLNAAASDDLDAALPELLRTRSLPARTLIALREDALAGLDRFKGTVPELFDNYLRLDRLDPAAARRAIEGPLARYNEVAGESVALEDGVAEEIVRQLAGDEVAIVERTPARRPWVEPAHLQLVMQRLWNAERALDSKALRLRTLGDLGGAHRIVRTHLRGAMDELPPPRQRLAFRVLNLLVTPSGMKVRHTPTDLARYVGAPTPEVRGLLDHLASQEVRVLRAADPPDGTRDDTAFELYHDVLAPAVLDWRTDYQARERGRLEARNRRLVGALVAVSAGAIGLVLYFWDPAPLRHAELRTVDERFGVRGDRAADPALVLVAIDERTQEELGGSLPLPRSSHARVMDRIDRDRPRTLVYDVIFQGARTLAGDEQLMAAMERARPRLVLAVFDFLVRPDDVQIVLLDRPGFIEEAGLRVGYSGLPNDPGPILRRSDYDVAPSEAVRFPTLALQGARVATGAAMDPAELPSVARRRWGSQSEHTTWIDYAGPEGTVRQVPFVDVLRDRVPAGYFRDKLVVVGTTARAAGDRHRTSAAGGDVMSGPEIQANALATLTRGVPTRDVPRIVDVLATLALAILPVAVLARRPALLGVAVVAVSGAAFLLAVQLTFNAGRVAAVVAPLIAFAVSIVGVAIATLARRRMVPATSADWPSGQDS